MSRRMGMTIRLTARGFADDALNIKANGLTYNLVFAIVPILALVFAFARGFGFQDMIEESMNDSFIGELDLVPTVMGFVEGYIQATHGGVFVGVGLLLLVLAVYNFFMNVERSFNDIWNVRRGRSFQRKLVNYLFVLFLIPILVVVTGGVNIFLGSAIQTLVSGTEYQVLHKGLVRLANFAVAWAVFVWMYKAIPNQQVKWRSALIPGVLVGTMFQLLEMLSMWFLVLLSRTSVIYGAFAVLPLMMIWLKVSCLLMLIGAEMSYAIQYERISATKENVALSHLRKWSEQQTNDSEN